MSCALRSAPLRAGMRRRFTLCITALLAVIGTGFAWYASMGLLGFNVREVVPGKLYRSAQPSVGELDDLVSLHGIHSVLSLRKDDPPAPELARELERLDRMGLPHANVPLSPQKLPRPQALLRLLQCFDAGPYPMLVHCEKGADRTGLAVVIWLVVYDGCTLADARARELSWRNGHFSFGQAHAMDDVLDLYVRTANGSDLRTWIVQTYPRLYDGRVWRHGHRTVLAHDGR